MQEKKVSSTNCAVSALTEHDLGKEQKAPHNVPELYSNISCLTDVADNTIDYLSQGSNWQFISVH